MRIDLKWSPFLEHQRRYFDFVPSAGAGAELSEDGLVVEKSAILGGYGGGKTSGMVRKAFALGCMNPWTEAYGRSNPIGILSAPTHRVLMQSLMTEFDKIVPRECILKRRGPPHNEIIMSNGFKWILHSGEAALEGVTACVVAIDEIAHPAYASNPRLYLNLLARLRDKNASRLAMLVAGLPESGWVRETFDKPGPDRQTILCGTRDNIHVPKATLNAFLSDCPSGQQESLVGGKWRAVDDAVYVQYDPRIHLTDEKGNPNAVTHVGMDVGNRGAILYAQQVPVQVRTMDGAVSTEQGLLIVDQELPRDESVEGMCIRMKASPWRIVPGQSRICIDPTTRRDEFNMLKKYFPGVTIIQRDKSDSSYSIESGIRQVQRALRDAHGNVRLKFNRSVSGVQHGVTDGLQRYRRNERSQAAIKDNSRDHCLDALRYLTCELIKPARAKAA